MKLIHAASALLSLGASAVDFGRRNGGGLSSLQVDLGGSMSMANYENGPYKGDGGKSGKGAKSSKAVGGGDTCNEPREPLRYFNRVSTFPVCR